MSKSKEKTAVELATSVVDGLRAVYKAKIRPIEEKFHFVETNSPCLEDSDFVAKPFILVLGQYSTGKTTFIEHLIQREYPGQRIGPEPTTDHFIAVMYGNEDRATPGNALATRADMPFRGLQLFGTAFLNKLEGVQCPAPFLESCTIIDTPGVLSGEKQRIGRSYDFSKVIEWWAGRSDLILLLFDAHKLDISDEFRSVCSITVNGYRINQVIQALTGHDDKVRVVLNKADSVSDQQLMRVYGALMWALGKCVATPEVLRVYIGSFWNEPYREGTNHALFAAEKEDLYKDIALLPKNAAIRKINDLIKRARAAKVHALLISHLRAQMPMFWKEAKQKELLDTMEEQFWAVQRKYGLAIGDFPDVNKFRETYQHFDFSRFPKLDTKLLQNLEHVLTHDIPELMAKFSAEISSLSLFADSGIPSEAKNWVISDVDFEKNKKLFAALSPVNGLADKNKAQQMLMKSQLPFDTLGQIWKAADYDQDGELDVEEFSVAMYLVYRTLDGDEVPTTLQGDLIPPSKRGGKGHTPKAKGGQLTTPVKELGCADTVGGVNSSRAGNGLSRSRTASPAMLETKELSEDPLSSPGLFG